MRRIATILELVKKNMGSDFDALPEDEKQFVQDISKCREGSEPIGSHPVTTDWD